uniref:G-protein coupled receptors family 1 profile domain-containing protein n=1 Tax=Romanomermis culicivorax TaxID=13658 RepID=A0A915INK3_ROMCU
MNDKSGRKKSTPVADSLKDWKPISFSLVIFSHRHWLSFEPTDMSCSLVVSDAADFYDSDSTDTADVGQRRNYTAYDCNCSNPEFLYVDVCDCDYPTEEPLTKILDDVLLIGFFYAIVFAVGVLGNVTVIYAVSHYSRLRTVTNVFLASLSISDLFLLLFCIPIQYVKYLSHTWIMGSFLCSSVHYVQMFTMTCSVLTLTTISIERYLAIAQPIRSLSLSSMGRAKRTLTVIWILSMFLAAPAWITNQTESFTTKKKRMATWCSRWYPKPVHVFEKLFVLYQTVILFAVPVATMTFCYLRIGCILYSAEREFYHDPEQSETIVDFLSPSPSKFGAADAIENNDKKPESSMDEEEDKQEPLLKDRKKKNREEIVIRMLIAIVLLFIICWSPYLVDDFLVAFRLICGQSNTDLLRYMRMAFALMAYSNSCQNPVVYAFMSKQFKQVFGKYYRKLCCCCSTLSSSSFPGSKIVGVAVEMAASKMATVRCPSDPTKIRGEYSIKQLKDSRQYMHSLGPDPIIIDCKEKKNEKKLQSQLQNDFLREI